MHQVWIPLDRIELNINARKIKASMQTQHYNQSRKRGLENLEKKKEYHFFRSRSFYAYAAIVYLVRLTTVVKVKKRPAIFFLEY